MRCEDCNGEGYIVLSSPEAREIEAEVCEVCKGTGVTPPFSPEEERTLEAIPEVEWEDGTRYEEQGELEARAEMFEEGVENEEENQEA